MKYIADRYPQGINDVDNDGRTPLHYAATVRDEQHTYNTLVGLGADEAVVDNVSAASHAWTLDTNYSMRHTQKFTLSKNLSIA